MSSSGFLFTAYVAVWVIHILYIGYLASRYSRLRREIEELKKSEISVEYAQTLRKPSA